MTTTNKPTQIIGHSFCAPKGFVFSLDASISFGIILIATLIFALTLNNFATSTTQQTTNFELEEKALLITDSLVKNQNVANTTLGACIYDSDKKRVKSNELSEENILNAKPFTLGTKFAQSISFTTPTKNKTITLDSSKTTKECLSVKRFVLIDGEKGIISIKICEEG